jgi:tetratricopeptide (TPR) repeat protein
MNPADVKLDKLGFPLPYAFDNKPVHDEPLPESNIAKRVARIVLILMAVGAGAAAIARAELGEPIKQSIAEWLVQGAMRNMMLDDVDGAIRDLDRAIAWCDEAPEIYKMRGQLRLEKGNVAGSLEDFTRATELSPRDSHAYLMRASALQRLQKHEAAIAEVTKAMEIHGEADATLLNSRAYFRALAGTELDEALDDVERALNSAQDNAAYLDTRGYVLYLKGEHRKALIDMNRAIMLTERKRISPGRIAMVRDPGAQRMLGRQKRSSDQEVAVMYHHRGQIQQALGNEAQAQADLRKGDHLGYNPAEGVY